MNVYRCVLQSAIAIAAVLYCCPSGNVIAGQRPTSPVVAEAGAEEYFITCDPAEFARIYENYEEDIYIPATITHKDKTWTNVQMRLRGDSSREFPKKSLKFKSDSGPFTNGRDVLNFNAEYLDNSFMHSVIGSRLFAAIGYPCFKAEPVRVYLNGSYLGLYVSIENIDDAFLIANGLDTKGNLYKATYDGACLSPGEDVYTLWEKKTNESTGREDLQALIKEMSSVPDGQYYDFAKRTFDYGKMVDIIAMNILTGNGSTYYHNYYMYHNPATNKWMMLPWDMDKTFTAYGVDLSYQRSTTSHPDNPFLERALMSEPIFNDICARMQELSSTVFTTSFLSPIIDSMAIVIESGVEKDTTDLNTSVQQWKDQLGHLKEYIANRYNSVKAQLAKEPRTFRIEPTAGLHRLPLKLRWHRAYDPDNNPLTYKLRISSRQDFAPNKTTEFSNLTDTMFTVESLPAEGKYFWTVSVSDGTTTTDGFDKQQSFTYRQGTTLPSRIKETLTLTEAGSPYVADSSIVVEGGAWLNAEPGVEIQMPHSANITVFGGVDMKGTAEKPVRIVATPGTDFWGYFMFKPNSKPSFISYAEINQGTRADTISATYAAKVFVERGNLKMDNVNFYNCYRGVWTYHGDVVVSHCHFPKGNFGEIIKLLGGTATIEYCDFHDVDAEVATHPEQHPADAIDLDSVSNAVIQFNRIYGSENDGIDIGSSNVTIIGNEIYNCADKSISLGESSHARIEGNSINSSIYGIAVKDDCTAEVDRCTIYNTEVAVGTYVKASATVSNSIIVQASKYAVFAEPEASITARYTLSDAVEIPGTGNIKADPLFEDAANGNFNLKAASPCIDAGDPQSAPDPDGTRADMGAHYFSKTGATAQVVINEIAYNPAEATDTDDWVELYNPDSQPVDISGWVFRDEDDSHTFTFPNNTLLPPYGYIVICADTVKFRKVFPTAGPILGNTGFGLAGGGELVRLFDKSGAIVDSLTYDDNDPWPTEPDGDGPTLELVSASFDNALGQSWKASKTDAGTPGAANSNTTDDVPSHPIATLFFLDQNYPNPFAERTTVSYTLLQPADISLDVYDALGKPVKNLHSGHLPAGKFATEFRAGNLPSGQYLYVLRVGGKVVKTLSATIVR